MIDPINFERTINGRQTSLIIIKNETGLSAAISNYGARIISLIFNEVNVTPGYSSLDPYMTAIAPYHGATIGRYANRITKGRFNLDSNVYSLPINNPPNHLHGGPQGFHARVWEIENSFQNSVVLSYLSKDGEEGYPGKLQVSVSYTVTEKNELVIEYKARTNAATPFNITNHAFFNLNGEGTILHHQLEINADQFTPVDKTLIPTSEVRNVEGTALDFRKLKPIGESINSDEEQIKIGGGYDHNFVLNKEVEGTIICGKSHW